MEEVLTLRRQVWIEDGTEELIMGGILPLHRGTCTEHLAVRGRQVRDMWDQHNRATFESMFCWKEGKYNCLLIGEYVLLTGFPCLYPETFSDICFVLR